MQELQLSGGYSLLEPGPVVLLTTADQGKLNLMTLSWHMMVEFEPPLLACVVSSDDYSFAALRASRECVIALPASALATKVVQAGNVSGRNIDKFALVGLTPLPALRVTAPLIAECFANLECKVVDSRLVNKYNLFVMEVVQAWIDPMQQNPKTLHHQGYGLFIVDGDIIELSSKMR